MLEDFIMLNQTTNGDELIKRTEDFPSIVVITGMLSVFSVVGTTGNAFVLYVFSRKKDKNTSTVFILALASIDFVTCIFVIPFTIVVEFMYKQVGSDAVCKIYQFFITSNVPFSAFIMVAIAFDRYFCICRPWMKVINIRVAKRIILCLLALALALGLITSLAYGVYHRKMVTKVRRNVTGGLNASDTAATSSHPGSVNSCNSSCNLDEDTFNKSPHLPTYDQPGSINTTGASITANMSFTTNDFIFTGFCFPNEAVFTIAFKRIYQKFYASLFLVAFIIVFILYALIYRSILTRRSRRLSTSLSEKKVGGMRSVLLSSIFNRANHVPTTLIRLDENTDVNKTDHTSKNAKSLQMTAFDMDTRAAVPEVSFYPHDTKTEVTRATSCHSFYSGSVMEDNASDVCCKEDDNINERSPLNGQHVDATPLDGPRVQTAGTALTSNTLVVPSPATYSRRKRTNKHRHVDDQCRYPRPEGTDKGCPAGAGHSPDTRVTKETHKTANCNVYRQDTRKSVREKHRLANIKTAGILFIVTLVFSIAFLPAWLMATKLIDPNMIIFYSYFIYNVANPVIYAFFNQSFQKEMKTVLTCVKTD